MSNLKNFLFTSESVSEGHPDKVSDRISDMVVDSYLSGDPFSRVACETLTTTNKVVLAGEVRGPEINKDELIEKVRNCIKDIGYDQEGFTWREATKIESHLHSQSADIAMGVDSSGNKDEGAGDQGIMFGYACNETDVLMPAPIHYSHKILRLMAEDRKSGKLKNIEPDSKSQVTFEYKNGKPFPHLVIDNFYNDPDKIREFVLKQEFKIRGNYPGQRTLSFASENIKKTIQEYIYPFAGKIIKFPINQTEKNYNGAFQYTTSRDRSWIHNDGWNNWAAVLYLTPNAPVTSGTGFYKYEDGTRYSTEVDEDLEEDIGNYCQDITKWTLVDKVGNVFNRMVIFNSKHYHCSLDYFGTNKENGRLFQVFFFSTENKNS